ncbi:MULTISPECIES: head-tail connector protein [unclassified Halomonas]|uniref:head-tail connector protein n=1 Tax=unclassified Halomonas TaxID=2609666 RepID=UPI00209D7F08|nr:MULTISPECIES: head-tail connector protein [unclassified Halomonas]MCP1314386.1 head-tail connector protein [Halomonas sp. 707D7]MCP1326059.1 head-tail connector protein [Halomonas sp. 707D4]
MLTLTRAKLHLRLAITEEEAEAYTDEDVLIQGLIDAAYQYAEHATQATLATRTKTLVLDAFPLGAGKIELPWTPVAAIESLDYIGPGGDEHSLEAEALRLDTRGIHPTLAPQWGSQWPRTIDEPECITITATAGADETPPDVQVALLLLIGHWYENRESAAAAPLQKVPMSVDMLLEPYRIHTVG